MRVRETDRAVPAPVPLQNASGALSRLTLNNKRYSVLGTSWLAAPRQHCMQARELRELESESAVSCGKIRPYRNYCDRRKARLGLVQPQERVPRLTRAACQRDGTVSQRLGRLEAREMRFRGWAIEHRLPFGRSTAMPLLM